MDLEIGRGAARVAQGAVRQQKVEGPVGVTVPVTSPPVGAQAPGEYVMIVADLLARAMPV